MDRLSFLKEEFNSVAVALREALRHDYGPERSKEFYDECNTRLQSIEYELDAAPQMSSARIADHLGALASVGSRVALLERSHLGEFSWPFAEAIRSFAERLFTNEEADGLSAPIVHVIAEGIGFQIFDDDLDRMFLKRIMIVAFPRQLRHHVLLHAIFGHELGHPATKSDATMPVIFGSAIPILQRGPLRDNVQMQRWLELQDSPEAVKVQIGTENAQFSSDKLRDWRFEILCDLFGLLLFGPAFAVAHRTLLEPLRAPHDEYDLSSSTHPPYPVRKRMIADAMRLLGWMEPICTKRGPHREAELAMLRYAGGDPPPAWTKLLDDRNLKDLLASLDKIFEPHPGISFKRPSAKRLKELLNRLAHCRPPIVQRLDSADVPRNFRVPIQHCLYAGWAFWFGKDAMRKRILKTRPDLPDLTFLDVNRLCEQALLQQRAIDAMPGTRK